MTSRRALTLSEVLIALAIIGVVFAALASLQITSLRVTAASAADTELLQSTVRGYERVRTVVLSDFRDFNRACSDIASTQEDPWALPGDWVCSGDLQDPDLAYDIEGEAYTGYTGLIEVTFTATRLGKTLTFSQFISCVDAVDTPALSDTSLCEL